MARTPRRGIVWALIAFLLLPLATLHAPAWTRAGGLTVGRSPDAATDALPARLNTAPAAPGPLSSAAVLSSTHVGTVAGAAVTTTHRLYFAEGFTGHGPRITFGETLTLFNTSPYTAFGRVEYFMSGGITSTVAITIPAQRSSVEDVTHDVGSDQQVSAVIASSEPIQAVRTITRTTGTATLAPSITAAINGLSRYWYFAEGYTGSTFQEYVELFNPSTTIAHVTLQPSSTAGSTPAAPILRLIPPLSRTTVNISAVVPHRQVALLVQSDVPIAAERTLYWGKGDGSAKYGTAVASGIVTPAAQWIFPYASTANKDQVFIAVMNPTPLEAHLHFTLYGDDGVNTAVISATVESGSRASIPIPSTISAISRFSIVTASDVPVVCEESQYFGGSPNSGEHAGSVLHGAMQSALHWVFPGISTDSVVSGNWYALNMGMSDAHLAATFLTDAGQPMQVHFRAPSGKLTALTIANLRTIQSNGASIWSSDAPVVMVQVARGPLNTMGIAFAGIAVGT